MPDSTLTIMSNIRALVLHSQIVNLFANRDGHGVFADCGWRLFAIRQEMHLEGQPAQIYQSGGL